MPIRSDTNPIDFERFVAQFKPKYIYWGKLGQTCLPKLIVQDGAIILETCAMEMLTILSHTRKGPVFSTREQIATVKLRQAIMQERSPYSENQVRHGLRSLEACGFIAAGAYKGNGETIEYTFLDPRQADPSKPRQALMMVQGDGMLHANRLLYFTISSVVITETTERWSMAQMPPSSFRVYIAILYLANEATRHVFTSTLAEIGKLTSFDRRTVVKALADLEERQLIFDWSGSAKINAPRKIELCNLYNGDELAAPPLYEEDDQGVSKRLMVDWNMPPDQVEATLRASIGDGPCIVQGDNRRILCPFHDDHYEPGNDPSCSVSLTKSGMWRCWSCPARGGFRKLLRKLHEKHGNPREVVPLVASIQGKHVKQHRPDSEAVIYDYKTLKGNLRKQYLRWYNPDDKAERKPNPRGGYIWSTRSLGAMLYHMELFDKAGVLCLVEGPKDADTVTNLKIRTPRGLIVGVTSGGANSWDDKLADELPDKPIILIPDNDRPGAEYAHAIKDSLDRRTIKYDVVPLAGTGAKDVTEFIELPGRTREEAREALIEMLPDWCRPKPLPNLGMNLMFGPEYEISF